MSGASGSVSRGPSRNDDEKLRIKKSLFSTYNNEGKLVEDYITHARINEMQSIHELLSPTQPAKERVAIVSILADGAVRVHKARENDNGSFQIGRTWGMQELTGLENPSNQVTGVVAHFGKAYFWGLSSMGAKRRFVQSMSQIYERFTQRSLNLIGFDDRPPSAAPGRSTPSLAGHPSSTPQPQLQTRRSETAPLRPVNPLVPNRRSQPHTDVRQPPPMSPNRNSAGASRQALTGTSQSPYPQTPSLPSLNREATSSSPSLRSQSSQRSQPSPAASAAALAATSAAAASPSIPPTSDLRVSRSVRREPSGAAPAKLASSPQLPQTEPSPQALEPQSRAELAPREDSVSASPFSSPVPSPGPGATRPAKATAPLARTAAAAPPMPPVPDRLPRSPERRRTFGSIPGTPRSRGSAMALYDTQRAWQSHSRHPSATSQQDGADFDRRQAFLDMETTLNELQWDGTRSVDDLEKEINSRLQHLGESNTSNVVSLGSRLDELEKLIDTSLDDSQMLQQLIGFFVVQLSSIGDEVSKIGGQGSEPQVVAMNQRSLFHELKDLLEMISLPEEVVRIVANSNLGSIRDLAQLEPALVELHRAVQTLEFGGDQGVGSMRVLQEQKGATLKLAQDFSGRVEAYLTDEFNRIASASPVGDTPVRIDSPFLAKTYPLASLVLFIKESDPARYQSLLSQYTTKAGHCYSDMLSTFAVRWKRSAEQTVGQRPVFTLQTKQQSAQSTTASSAAAAALAKRTKSLRQPHPKPATAATTKNEFALSAASLAALERLYDQVVEAVSLHVTAQQQLLVRFFHLSSHGGRRFDLYIRQVPVDVRLQQAEQFSGQPLIGEVDTSRQESANTRRQVSLVFSKMDDLVNTVAGFVGQSTVLESVYLIAKLEAKLESLQSKDQEFLVEMLNKLHNQLTHKWTACIDEQVRLILGSHVTKKRHGFLEIVSKFTQFVLVVEQALHDVQGIDIDNLPVRKLVDQAHDQLFRAFLQIFVTSSTTVAEGLEDKEMLNHHVTLISNLNGIITKLDSVPSYSIQNILLQAKKAYRTDMEAYINDVLHRPIGRIIEFVNLSKSAKFKNIKPKSQLAALKKAVVGFDSKELRKSTDTLRKRVEKHFMPDDGEGDPALLEKVWRAIGAQYLDYFNQIMELAKKVDGENALEFTKQDITAAFS